MLQYAQTETIRGPTMTTGELPPDRKMCVSCRSSIPKEAQACPHCGSAQPSRDEMLRPLGGEFAAPVRRPKVPPPPEPEGPAVTGTGATRAAGGRSREVARPVGQEGAAGFVKEMWRADRWFVIVLGIVAAQGVIALLTRDWFGVVIAAIVVWGLLVYNYWVYIVVVIVYGFGLFGGVLGLILGQGWSLVNVLGLAVSAAVFGVLIDRYSHYV
jgi:predicted RNA-binding Zn-ribbon protein involved in translation (DUF1610 family)